MRKVLIGLAIVVVLVAGAVYVSLRNLDAYVTENRDLVAAEVGKTLGREVAFEKVGISWAGGFGVRVEGLRVGDDPAYSKEDFLTADAVDVRVKLLPAFFGKIEVGRVILRAPRLRVTQTKDGLSTDSLGGGAGRASAGAAEGAATGGPAPALAIALLDMRDASLRFVDESVRPVSTLEVDQLDVQASEIALDEPVNFEVAAALFGASARNFEAKGSFGPLTGSTPEVDVEVELDRVSLDKALAVSIVRELLPGALGGSGPVSLDATFDGTLDEMVFDVAVDADAAAVQFGGAIDKAPGVGLDVTAAGTKRGDQVDVSRLRVVLDDTDVTGTAKVALGKTTEVDFDLASDAIAPAAFGVGEGDDRVRDLSLNGAVALASAGPRGTVKARSPSGRLRGADYTNLVADLKLNGDTITIQQATADAFGGKLAATGVYATRRDGSPRFDVDTQLQQMRIEELVRMVSGRAARLLNGTVDVNLALDGAGNGWEQIRRVLNGNGDLRLRNGVLKEINPAGDALRALMLIPTFGQAGIGRVLEKYPALLGEGDTQIDDLASTFSISQGWLQVRELAVRTTEYVLNGSGRYSLAGELDFKTALTFGEMLSGELLAAEPDLRYIREASGKLELPVALRGTPPKVAVVPDVSKLAGNAAREALTDVITDALGVPKQKPQAPTEGGAQQPAGGLLGGILDEALGGKRRPAEPAPSPPAQPAPSPPAEQGPGAPAPTQPAQPPTPEQVGEELLRRGLQDLLGGGQ